MKDLLAIAIIAFLLYSCSHNQNKESNVSISKSTTQGSSVSSTFNNVKSSLPFKPGVPSFSIQYNETLVVKKSDYSFIDLFNYTDKEISELKSLGNIVLCYFSSQYEDWHDDSKDFQPKDLGNKLDKWPGEKWVNPQSQAIKDIMIKRIALAKSKGCQGVDVDNIDFSNRKTGFDSSLKTSVEYASFLCNEAHKSGLLFSQKNGIELIQALKGCADTYQNESCQQYNECDSYKNLNKPIFNIEYSGCKKLPGIYSIRKKSMNGIEWECK